jgi:hypothetical protein
MIATSDSIAMLSRALDRSRESLQPRFRGDEASGSSFGPEVPVPTTPPCTTGSPDSSVATRAERRRRPHAAGRGSRSGTGWASHG